MKRQWLWSLCLIGGALLVALLMVQLRPTPAEEERIEQVPLVEVVPFEASAGPIPISASGTVQAREEVTIGVQVPGRLTYVHPALRVGGVIPAGATLLRIDEAEYRNDVRIAQADVAAQDVEVLQAEEEVAIAREELARFSARQNAGAGSTIAGSTQIRPPEELSQQISEDPEPRQGDATGTLATREPQLRSARAARDRATASLADANLSLARTRIKAPFRGLVREESAAVGSLVQPGQALGSIVSIAAYEVRLSLTPNEAALIPGLLNARNMRIPASLTYEYGGQTYRWTAVVDRANSILDTATRNIEVFLRVPSPIDGGQLLSADGEVVPDASGDAPPLLLGSFVSAEIMGTSLASFAVIPAQAIRPGNQVWVVREGKLEIIEVRVLQRTDDKAYIVASSLGEGGAVVTSSLSAPIDRMAVRVTGGLVE